MVGMATADTVLLDDGRELPLAGLGPAALTVEIVRAADEAVRGRWEAERVVAAVGPWLGASPRASTGAAEPAPNVVRWRLTREGKSLGASLLESGLAAADLSSVTPTEAVVLLDRVRRAQRARAGLWASRGPLVDELRTPLGGVVLPMHSKDPDFAYDRHLGEIRDLGAGWVQLVVVTRQPRVDSSRVPPTSDRTPSIERVVATIRAARELGLDVLVMPIVLIQEPGPDDWRGALAPRDPVAWWRSYHTFLLRIADAAASGGATALAVGSELSSLERHEEAWRHLILNVSARFPGLLTYSANWDHFDRIGFWDALDFAGTNAYFELTDPASADGPTDAELRAGWRAGLEEVRRLAAVAGRPVVLTEVGIPSRVGGLATPWDHTLSTDPAPEVQARGFRTFADVFLPDGRPAPGVAGLFLYDWWTLGGEDDPTYTARGKPAEAVWRRILADLEESERPAAPDAAGD